MVTSVMSFLIRPNKSKIDPPKLVCCVDGKTPTEPEDFTDDFIEDTVDNGDGTRTVTWTTITDNFDIRRFNFYLCCSSRVVVVWNPSDPSAVFPNAVTVEGNGESGVIGKPTAGGWTWDSQVDSLNFPTKPGLTINDMLGPCGLNIDFELTQIDVGETNALSITY